MGRHTDYSMDFIDDSLEFWSKEDVDKYIGKKIKELRKKREWSQDQLALRISLEQSTISDLEKGKCNAAHHIYNAAIAFGVSVDTLFPQPKESMERRINDAIECLSELREKY